MLRLIQSHIPINHLFIFFEFISTLQWKEFILYKSYDFATYERNDAVLTQWFDAFDENTAITMFEIYLVEFAENCKLCTFQSSSIKRWTQSSAENSERDEESEREIKGECDICVHLLDGFLSVPLQDNLLI